MPTTRRPNRHLVPALLTGVMVFALAPTAAQAATYLKLAGVNGVSQGMPGWILVDSFSLSVASPDNAGGGSGREQPPKITINKLADADSPELSRAAAEGHHFATADIEVTGPRGELLEHYELREVVISALKITDTGARPHETLTLTCARMATERVPGMGPMRAGQATRLD